MSKYRAILIAGPTAGGKSAAALALAERLGGVIVNADSMQVYSDLRVLTARPGADDEARVPHALYGFVPAAEAYSAGRWAEDVKAAVEDAERAGRVPIIAGGTGLYFKVLLEGLSPIPDIPDDIRRHWRKEAAMREAAELHSLLWQRDREMAGRLRPSDPQRVVRALEVLEATGRSLADWQEEPGTPVLREKEVLRLHISPPREALYERIDTRFDAMIEQGALEEVATLAEQRLDPDLPAMRALGVRPLMAHMEGTLDREGAVRQAKTETRRYAKRQLTWAKSNMIAWNRIETKYMESFRSNIFSFIDV